MAYHGGKLSQRRTALLNKVAFWSWGASTSSKVTKARWWFRPSHRFPNGGRARQARPVHDRIRAGIQSSH